MPYVTADDIDRAMGSCFTNLGGMTQWQAFDKCHFLVDVKNEVSMRMYTSIVYFNTINRKCDELLGVKFNYKLSFDSNISEIVKKAKQNIKALARVESSMCISKWQILINAFVVSQFN